MRVTFIFMIYCSTSLWAQDSLIMALRNLPDEKEGKALASEIIKKCAKDEACYEPYLMEIFTPPTSEGKLFAISRLSQSLYTNSFINLSKRTLLKGVEMAQKQGQKSVHLGSYYNYLTLVYKDINSLDSALYYAQLTMNEFKQHKPEESLWAPNFNRYLIYLQLSDTDKADQSLRRSYELIKHSTSRMDKGFVLFTMVKVAKIRWGEEKFNAYLDEYLRFKLEANPNKKLDVTHTGLLDFFDDKEEAIIRLEKRLAALLEENSNALVDQTRMALAEKYEQQGAYTKAIHQIETALSEEIGYTHNQKESYIELYDLYKKIDNPPMAYASIEKYIHLQDSSFQQILNSKIADYEVTYQTQLKENELMKKDIELKDLRLDKIKLLGGGGMVLIAAFSALLFYYRRLKFQKKISLQEQEINKQRIMDLEQKNKLLALSSMIEGQESERLRIAQDLHDGLGGLLTSVKAHFNTISRELDAVSKINVFQKTNDLIDEACGEVRRIAHDMIPHALTLQGLEGVLSELKSNIEGAGMMADIEVHYDLSVIPDQKATMIYRILQEIVQNTIKHAKGSKLLIQFYGDENNLHILTEDDGRGFDLNELINKQGMGLKSLESRMQYLGGKMNIDSKIGRGTAINMNFPIP